MRNGTTRINGTIRVAMLLSPREIDRDERQGDALLGEEHAHASSNWGMAARDAQLECLGYDWPHGLEQAQRRARWKGGKHTRASRSRARVIHVAVFAAVDPDDLAGDEGRFV